MELPCYNLTSQKKTSYKVKTSLLDETRINANLLKFVYNAHLANLRRNLAVVKNRSDVRGGGRKPYRQKGTGQARAGTIRSPLWRGGGVVFGPSGQENYKQKVNRRIKRLAQRQALSLQKEKIIVLESLPTDGRTKTFQDLFAKLKLKRNILLIDNQGSTKSRLAVQNMSQVELIGSSYLNTFRILNADHLVFSRQTLDDLEQSWQVAAKKEEGSESWASLSFRSWVKKATIWQRNLTPTFSKSTPVSARLT